MIKNYKEYLKGKSIFESKLKEKKIELENSEIIEGYNEVLKESSLLLENEDPLQEMEKQIERMVNYSIAKSLLSVLYTELTELTKEKWKKKNEFEEEWEDMLDAEADKLKAQKRKTVDAERAKLQNDPKKKEKISKVIKDENEKIADKLEGDVVKTKKNTEEKKFLQGIERSIKQTNDKIGDAKKGDMYGFQKKKIDIFEEDLKLAMSEEVMNYREEELGFDPAEAEERVKKAKKRAEERILDMNKELAEAEKEAQAEIRKEEDRQSDAVVASMADGDAKDAVIEGKGKYTDYTNSYNALESEENALKNLGDNATDTDKQKVTDAKTALSDASTELKTWSKSNKNKTEDEWEKVKKIAELYLKRIEYDEKSRKSTTK